MGWRVIENSRNENLKLAESQFDSLLAMTDEIDRKYLTAGLEVKSKLNKNDEVIKIIGSQDIEMQRRICLNDFLGMLGPCKSYSEEKIDNEQLQKELIRMYVDDQACRDNIMVDMVDKYNVPRDQITVNGCIGIDKQNRARLKEIFAEIGFPSRKMIGIDAMFGVFMMIQHSEGDQEWQKSQLPNIEKAVERGDLQGQSYAYLYDRIKINSGEKQRYGSQFSKVDIVSKVVKLAPTEDIENLDNRRKKMGMMPIEMYKRIALKNL